MCSKSRLWLSSGLSASIVLALGCLFGVGGCNPQKDQLRPDNLLGRLGRQNGQIIEPRKCMLRVAILNRSLHEGAINEAVWKVADEQAIAPEARRALEVNGLRIGQISGELPPELEAVLTAPPPHKVEPATFLLDDGEQTLVNISEPVDQVSLLLNRANRPYGKDFLSASGYFRVTAGHDGTNGISLRLTPEIHHGPVQRSFQPIASPSPYSPQELRINDGQQEESLRDLAADLILEPGQVAVIGCRPDQERSLGAFLFTQAESHGDQRRQKLILIWAGRNQLGAVGEKASKSDRPVPSPDVRPQPEALPKKATTAVSKTGAKPVPLPDPAKAAEYR
jgi:hypothetical protein